MRPGFAFLVVGLAALAPGKVARGASTGDELFSCPIQHFKIEIGARELEKLRRQNRVYVNATVSMGAKVFKDVAVRLKGQGSFRPLNDKPSFALKFNEFTPKQKLFGLSKIMLNNSTQDTTLLSEYLATSLFRDAGVPAARVTHARVTLNGRELGFYVLIEAMNKTFLKQHFRNANGNLYEGYAKDIDQSLEHDGGPPGDQSDRRALVAASRSSTEDGMAGLRQILDIDRFYSFLAVSILIAQHDSYPFNRNNYRIYHEPDSGRFVMIPHGIDGTFRDNNISIRPPAKYILSKAVLTTPDGGKLYRARAATLFTNVFKLDVMSNRVQIASARLLAAATSDQERTDIARHMTNFLHRVTLRHARAAQQLGQPEPSRILVDADTGAVLTGWQPDIDEGTATLERRSFEGRPALYANTGPGRSLGVWRMRAVLDPGRYRLSGLLQTSNALQRGSTGALGAGIRTFKMYATPKRVFADGTWKNVEHHFLVAPGEEEVEFLCELAAPNAEAWFDAQSIKVLRE